MLFLITASGPLEERVTVELPEPMKHNAKPNPQRER